MKKERWREVMKQAKKNTCKIYACTVAGRQVAGRKITEKWPYCCVFGFNGI